MTDDPKEILLEEAVSAYRERTASGRILPSPAWWDLTPESREELFRRQLQSRIIESALAPDGMSATVRSVLNRLKYGAGF
jgi:hypothetical protein